MLLLFVILVALGASSTMLFLFTYANDRKAFRTQLGSMARPIILLVLATGCWAGSMPAFTGHDAQLIQMPSYTISANTVGGSNTLYTVSSSNIIIDNSPINSPSGAGSFYTYFPLWLAIMILHVILLILTLLTWMADAADDAITGRD